MRNLDQIQESDGESRTPRGVTLLLVALGGACVVFASLALGGRGKSAPAQKLDPLGDLVTHQGRAPLAMAARPTDLSARDVTFPGILSDEGTPTTALAAVKGNSPPPKVAAAPAAPEVAVGFNAQQGAPPTLPQSASPAPATPLQGAAPMSALNAGATEAAPPPPADRLPVVPLPAQHVLAASPVVTRPRDSLTRAANDAAQLAPSDAPAAAAGHDGGYQLQVSSFRTQAEADQFATQLRARGHKAHVVEARVPGRGTWYRVRIGPFPSQLAAASYRSGFEGREHVVPFIVPPSSR